jgi:hypothetical protein
MKIRLVAFATLAACSACHRGAPLAENVAANAADDRLVVNTNGAASGNYAVPNDIKPLNRPLPEAALGSAEAGMDLLHRAIALVQTGQLNDLNKLLTPAAQAALARAGGSTLLRSHRDDRAEIGNSGPVANQGSMARLDVPIKIHIALGEREELREGVVTLMRESASSDGWLIAEWRLVPKPDNRTTR